MTRSHSGFYFNVLFVKYIYNISIPSVHSDEIAIFIQHEFYYNSEIAYYKVDGGSSMQVVNIRYEVETRYYIEDLV